jgi:hypothetical protein
MTQHHDPDRLITTFLMEGQTELADQVYDAVRASIEHRRQRVVIGPWRLPTMNKLVPIGIGVAAVAVVAVVGIQLLPSAPGGVGAEPSADPSAVASPSVAVEQTRLTVTGGPEAVPFVVDVPLTWRVEIGHDQPSIVRGDTTPPAGMFVAFLTAANTFVDPCGRALRSPEVGPTVDDLVAALAETPNMTSTEPIQTTLGGRTATYIELTADDELPCPADAFYLFAMGAGAVQPSFYLDGPRQIVRTWVLDVDGTRVVALALHFPEATAEALAEEQAILDSVEFEPAS